MSITVALRPETDDFRMPQTAYEGDAGFDLTSTREVTVAPFERVQIPCGFSMAIPQGYAGLVLPRSGLALKHGISLANTPGLIDSGYRGEVGVIVVNLDSKESFHIARGDRIAQLVIIKLPAVDLKAVSELPVTDRGIGGFGSSGVSYQSNGIRRVFSVS